LNTQTQTPQVSFKKTPYAAKLLEPLTNGGADRSQLQNDASKESTNPQHTPKVLVLPQEGENKLAVLQPGEAPNCAHIILFQAPEMDSPILKEAPKHFDSNMPKIEGLPPRSRDFRLSRRALQFPGQFFQRPFGQFPSAEPTSDRPKQNEAPAAKP